MARVVIDTSVLVGFLDDADHWHPRAITLFDRLNANGDEAIYLDCVLGETISVITRRMREQGRSEQIPHMVDEIGLRIPDREIMWAPSEWHRLYRAILGIVKQTSGVLNFNDALIALLCREWGIGTIASFDQGFDTLTWVARISS